MYTFSVLKIIVGTNYKVLLKSSIIVNDVLLELLHEACFVSLILWGRVAFGKNMTFVYNWPANTLILKLANRKL